MSGNVWEWCNDWYFKNYYLISDEVDPQGTDTGEYKAMRGGSWRYALLYLRVVERGNTLPTFRDWHIGFRLCRNQ